MEKHIHDYIVARDSPPDSLLTAVSITSSGRFSRESSWTTFLCELTTVCARKVSPNYARARSLEIPRPVCLSNFEIEL